MVLESLFFNNTVLSESSEKQTIRMYINECTRLSVEPIFEFIISLSKEKGKKGSELNLSDRKKPLSDEEFSSICKTLEQRKTQISTLHLSNNKLTSNGMKFLRSVFDRTSHSNITSLDISGNVIGDRGCQHLVGGVMSTRKLRSLKMRECGISNSGFVSLCSLVKENIIERMDLNSNSVSDEGVKFLSNSLRSNYITLEINLGANQISDNGVMELAKCFASNNTLSCLILDNNNITKIGGSAIAKGITTNQGLKILNLNYNVVSQAAEVFAECLKKNRNVLEELYLGFNQIEQTGLRALIDMLKHNTKLKKIDLSGCTLDYNALLVLKEGLSENNYLTELFIDTDDDGKCNSVLDDILNNNQNLKRIQIGEDDNDLEIDGKENRRRDKKDSGLKTVRKIAKTYDGKIKMVKSEVAELKGELLSERMEKEKLLEDLELHREDLTAKDELLHENGTKIENLQKMIKQTSENDSVTIQRLKGDLEKVQKINEVERNNKKKLLGAIEVQKDSLRKKEEMIQENSLKIGMLQQQIKSNQVSDSSTVHSLKKDVQNIRKLNVSCKDKIEHLERIGNDNFSTLQRQMKELEMRLEKRINQRFSETQSNITDLEKLMTSNFGKFSQQLEDLNLQKDNQISMKDLHSLEERFSKRSGVKDNLINTKIINLVSEIENIKKAVNYKLDSGNTDEFDERFQKVQDISAQNQEEISNLNVLLRTTSQKVKGIDEMNNTIDILSNKISRLGDVNLMGGQKIEKIETKLFDLEGKLEKHRLDFNINNEIRAQKGNSRSDDIEFQKELNELENRMELMFVKKIEQSQRGVEGIVSESNKRIEVMMKMLEEYKNQRSSLPKARRDIISEDIPNNVNTDDQKRIFNEKNREYKRQEELRQLELTRQAEKEMSQKIMRKRLEQEKKDRDLELQLMMKKQLELEKKNELERRERERIEQEKRETEYELQLAREREEELKRERGNRERLEKEKRDTEYELQLAREREEELKRQRELDIERRERERIIEREYEENLRRKQIEEELKFKKKQMEEEFRKSKRKSKRRTKRYKSDDPQRDRGSYLRNNNNESIDVGDEGNQILGRSRSAGNKKFTRLTGKVPGSGLRSVRSFKTKTRLRNTRKEPKTTVNMMGNKLSQLSQRINNLETYFHQDNESQTKVLGELMGENRY